MISLVTAIIKPHVLDAVGDALQEAGYLGMTITEVHGMGRQGGHTETYRGAEYQVSFVPKIRIDLVVETGEADRAVKVIAEAARTGVIGDGKIWAHSLARVMRIRSGEVGAEAV